MGVTRTYVFPALRIAIWAVIAAALVVMAFRGAELDQADALQPTGEITQSVIDVGTGTVTNAVTVPASVVADPPVEVKATAAGVVSKISTPDGPVAADAVILVIKQETPRDPLVRTDPETGEQTVTEQKPKVTYTSVKAPIAGTLASSVLVDQQVSVGDVVAKVSPESLSVQGQLTADQQYRLVGAAGDAQVTLKGGPAPFTCGNLRIGSTPQPGGEQPPAGEPGASATGTVACSIPGDVTAFPGLGAEIEIVNGTADDAVVVPISAVLGSAQTGKVWVVASDDAEPEERTVTLGLTDGSQVQIAEGLAAGDRILEFTPIPDATEAGPDCSDTDAYDQAAMDGDMSAVRAYEEACFG
ncbi:secretion protein HlyD [Xylanimonas oleitrophica]|uniref:Secretion protein HlyD n=1 Tax=Xylanimonas oleitrophica TaxID=2607479 RepID=A0A2W5Y8V1_9MICO|nr:secretion protein HlyD [Xylanimonas oleitrophica]PZR54974.1 secretion protein HlyD [Xylanimonas oleitrophica]